MSAHAYADSSNDEISLTEILHEIPESKNNLSIPSPNPAMNTTNTSANNDNIITLAIKVMFALVVSQLQKLPISSRIIHQFLILHFVLSMIGLSRYLMLCAPSIIDDYQYWRFITYNFSDTNVFMALIGCITLSDIIKRMEYYFGSLWTLYLFTTNWFLLSLFTFLIQYVAYTMNSVSILELTQCQCIGLYPMIFSLWIIEIMLSFPSMQYHIFGVVYTKQIYHPIIYCLLYNVFIRFDIATIIAITYSALFLYCIPSIFHLSRYKIQKIQNSKWLQCVLNDKLFISIENIDYDCFVSTGKYISAKSDKNTDLLLQDTGMEHEPTHPVPYHSTMMIQRNLMLIENDENAYDNSDREDLPFIISNVPIENVDDIDIDIDSNDILN